MYNIFTHASILKNFPNFFHRKARRWLGLSSEVFILRKFTYKRTFFCDTLMFEDHAKLLEKYGTQRRFRTLNNNSQPQNLVSCSLVLKV